MKSKSLSSQSLPSRSALLSLIKPNSNLAFSNSSRFLITSRQLSSADPFENMKFAENKRPALRPIINKHRKCQSIENTSDSISSRVSNSKPIKKEPALPLIFSQKDRSSHKGVVYFTTARRNIGNLPEQLNISTPYFKCEAQGQGSVERSKNFFVNKKSRARFFDHINERKLQEKRSGDVLNGTLGFGFKNL